MKLRCIPSLATLLALLLMTGCNPDGGSGDDKSNSGATQNPVDDSAEPIEENHGPTIGFTSVDFQSVPDDYYTSGGNLLIGIAAEITDPDGDDDIVFAGFIFDNEDGERARITLKDTRAETIVEDQQNDFEESLNLYYDVWYFYNDAATTWNIQNLYFFAYDSENNYVRKDYVVSKPNGDAISSETFAYSPIAYSGETANGVEALSAPEISLFTWNSTNGQIILELSGNDDRIHTTQVKFYYNDNSGVYSQATVNLENRLNDGSTQTYTFPEGSITLDDGQTNGDIIEARILVTDDPDQELPVFTNWWHYQSWSSKVLVTDI